MKVTLNIVSNPEKLFKRIDVKTQKAEFFRADKTLLKVFHSPMENKLYLAKDIVDIDVSFNILGYTVRLNGMVRIVGNEETGEELEILLYEYPNRMPLKFNTVGYALCTLKEGLDIPEFKEDINQKGVHDNGIEVTKDHIDITCMKSLELDFLDKIMFDTKVIKLISINGPTIPSVIMGTRLPLIRESKWNTIKNTLGLPTDLHEFANKISLLSDVKAKGIFFNLKTIDDNLVKFQFIEFDLTDSNRVKSNKWKQKENKRILEDIKNPALIDIMHFTIGAQRLDYAYILRKTGSWSLSDKVEGE